MIFNDEEDEKKKAAQKPDALAEKFLKTRQILLSGEINKELAQAVNKQLLLLEADGSKPIYVYIDSPGGDVSAGFAIFDMIRFVNAPVVLVGNGLIASAAALILLAVPKERRVGWYASQLEITAKYLSEVVKNVSKRTPNEWIDSYVVLELRVLLKNSPKSIKEITEELNFPNQSFLGKYFKEHVGVSPSEYRKG